MDGLDAMENLQMNQEETKKKLPKLQNTKMAKQ